MEVKDTLKIHRHIINTVEVNDNLPPSSPVTPYTINTILVNDNMSQSSPATTQSCEPVLPATTSEYCLQEQLIHYTKNKALK